MGKKIKIKSKKRPAGAAGRLPVIKTYKLFLNDGFQRSESGRYLRLNDNRGNHLCNLSRASRKDFRNAVVHGRKAWPGWAARTAYNRGQILYRIAETLESRKPQFAALLVRCGETSANANAELAKATDRLIYFAGWCDKYSQVFSAVNPVSSPHFNFSYPESMGVVAMVAPENGGLLGPVSLLAPALAGGNTVVLLADHHYGPVGIELAEVIQASDVPAGVTSLLTGDYDELAPHFYSHMDVNAVVNGRQVGRDRHALEGQSALNVKRVFNWTGLDGTTGDNPYLIMDLQEVKTTWHPIGL